MKRLRIMIILLTVITPILFASCDHKELCYHHDHRITLRLAFDWRDAPEASPKGMVVWFYPTDDTEGDPLRIDISGTEGGEIKVPPGKYNIISYNNDTELSRIDGVKDFLTHRAYTREGSLLEPVLGYRSQSPGNGMPRPDGTEDQHVVVSPDEIWGCNALEVVVTEQGVSYLCFPLEEKDDWYGKPPIVTEHVITLYPHDLVCHYSYEVRNVKNLGQVTNMCGVLTGMSPSLYFHDESTDSECVSIPLPAYKADDTTIRGEFLTFGHNAGNEAPHRFGLYLWLSDGKSLFYGKDGEEFDVTHQVDSAPNPRRVHLIIDGPELPPVVGDEGWNPSFDDWNNINKDIYM